MLTAYLDESGHESAGNMFIAGHVGDGEQWRLFADRWRLALGRRKHLHMNELRWNNPRTKALLDRLGVIPTECGLTRIAGGVKASDYLDLIQGEEEARALKGYYFALTGLVTNLARWVPDHERCELVLEDQRRYRDVAKLIVRDVATSSVARNSWGGFKIAKWSFVPKGSLFLEQADYFAYALLQLYRDKESKKTAWCRSIMGDMNGVGAILTRKQIRFIVTAAHHLQPSSQQRKV
jgi:hypothetical protein